MPLLTSIMNTPLLVRRIVLAFAAAASLLVCRADAVRIIPWYRDPGLVLPWHAVPGLPGSPHGSNVDYQFLDSGNTTYLMSSEPGINRLWRCVWTNAANPVFEEFPLTFQASYLSTAQVRFTTMARTSNGVVYVGSDAGVFRLNEATATLETFWLFDWDPSFVTTCGDDVWWYVSMWGSASGIHRWTSSQGHQRVYSQPAVDLYGSVLDGQTGTILLTNVDLCAEARLMGSLRVLRPDENLVLLDSSFSTDRGQTHQPIDPNNPSAVHAAIVYSDRTIIAVTNGSGLTIGELGHAFSPLAYPGSDTGGFVQHYSELTRTLFAGRMYVGRPMEWFATQLPPPGSGRPAPFANTWDFDADLHTDISVYHPGGGDWYILQSGNSQQHHQNWGWSAALPAPGDYDGDGHMDIAVYDAAGAKWYILQSRNGQLREDYLVSSVGAVPVPGDYDGDGSTDVAVYEPASGYWYVRDSSSAGVRSQNWGWSAAMPVPGDYDGDSLTDLAVYHPASGDWYIRQSSTGQLRQQNWGWSAAMPVPGDYDGDGLTDLAVYHSASGEWFIRQSSTGQLRQQNWGWSAAMPVPGDYDGDSLTDLAVYHPASGDWYIRQSATGQLRQQNWGWAEALPVLGQYGINRRYGFIR